MILLDFLLKNPTSRYLLLFHFNTLYHCKMQKGKNKKSFMVYTVEEFIAAITQHNFSKKNSISPKKLPKTFIFQLKFPFSNPNLDNVTKQLLTSKNQFPII